MPDIEFRITEGPYQGKYALDLADITANDVGDLLSQHGPDLDAILAGGEARGTRAIAALVWVVRRRGTKGLAYRGVAQHINFAIFEGIDDVAVDDSGAADGDAAADDKEPTEKLLDPSSNAGT